MTDLYWADPELAAEWLSADTIDLFGVDAHVPEWMVPVERCKHGNVFPHSYVQTNMDGDAWEEIGCPGSPTLAERHD